MSKTCSVYRHPFMPHRKVWKAQHAQAGIQWPSFTGSAQLVGRSKSGRVSVYFDASLGAQASQNAQDLLAAADTVAMANDALFGRTGGPVNVIVFALGGSTDGTGGADHMACDYVNGANIEVDASYGNSARVIALFEAELSECSMGGNLCGESTGEALSRWCAMVVGGDVLEDFASAPVWAQDGMPNWVDQTENTDQDYDSIGCGMAFLSWLQSQSITLGAIASSMVTLGDNGTLADLYNFLGLGPISDAWTWFSAAVNALSAGVNSDDPFGVLSPCPTPVPAPPPPTPTSVQLADQIIEAVIAAVAAQDSVAQLKAAVQALVA